MPSKAPSKRTERQQSSYSKILDAAAKVFDEKGFDRATVQDIADTAQLTKGGLYHHLRSKNEALFGINKRILNASMAQMPVITKDPELSVVDRLHRVVQVFVEQHDTFTPDLRVALRDFDRLEPLDRQEVVALRDRLESYLRELLVEGIEAGLFVDEDPDLLVKYVFGAINWMCMWYRTSGDYSATTVGEIFARTTVAALTARDPEL